MLKPDSEIYIRLLEKFGLKAEECLFIDDMEANTETAQELGWKTYCFDGDVNKLKNHIRKILEEERNADK